MKKMVIAAAVVLAAVISQAAQVNWSLARDSASPYLNNTLYIIEGANYDTAFQTLTKGGEGVGADFQKFVVGTATIAKNGSASGLVENLSGKSLAYFIFNTEIADGNTFDTTGVLDITASIYTPPDSNPGSFSIKAASFGSTGNKIGATVPPPTPDVPEPTSGLLLAIGGAALALRRKQK